MVKCLEVQGVEYIFGIPGAKVDAIFNALVDSPIQFILCRHEQNAAFMAAAYGRLTGKPGVVLVTSGPGVTNIVTGLLTANTENDPVVAIAANVPRAMRYKSTHQRANNAELMTQVSKFSIEIITSEQIPEIIATAFDEANKPRRGAAFISIPQDILMAPTTGVPLKCVPNQAVLTASKLTLEYAALQLEQARNPVLLLGESASQDENVAAIRHLLSQCNIVTMSTYQGAGVVSKALFACFVGRVGLFKNQIADILLDKADVVLTIGFNPVEYDPEIWNATADKLIIHLSEVHSELHYCYQPPVQILGSIAENTKLLAKQLKAKHINYPHDVSTYHERFEKNLKQGKKFNSMPVHPLRFLYELAKLVDDNTIVACDIGSMYVWLARYFVSFHPHQLLFSNGQQTLGVGLPWGMAAKLIYPKKRVISISGDGGFLFSAMELETAVREKIAVIHFVWIDGSYDMVKEQAQMKYNRSYGVNFGAVNLINFAQAFGAKGYLIEDPDDILTVFHAAEQQQGPVLIGIPIDYRDNAQLYTNKLPTDN